MVAPANERVLILDFGAQYSQLIARRVREQNIFCQIVRHDLPLERIRELQPRGLILSGGPSSVYAPNAPRCDPALFQMGVPVLGICYGMQLACLDLGSDVKPAESANVGRGEYGRAVCHVKNPDDLLVDVGSETIVWMSHGDQVHSVNGDFEALAGTDTCPVAAVKHRKLPVFGLQFHPEVSHTPEGKKILHNFLYRICGCTGQWKIASFIDDTVADLRQRIGNARVICGLSGGVDSSVTAALLIRAVGKQVACIFVDSGR